MARPTFLTGKINQEDLTSIVSNTIDNMQFVANDLARNLGKQHILYRRAIFITNKTNELLWAIEEHKNT